MRIAILALVLALSTSSPAAETRSFASGFAAVEIDGAIVGLVESVEGGDLEADVIEDPTSSRSLAKRHIANSRYEDMTFNVGAAMSQEFWDWLNTTLTNEPEYRKGGQLRVADSNGFIRQVREFKKPLVTDIELPSCDSTSKEPSFATIRWRIESAVDLPTPKARIPVPSRTIPTFESSNFSLAISGLDTSQVVAISPIRVKCDVVPASPKDGNQTPPASCRASTFTVTIAEAVRASWDAWAQSFIGEGKSDDSQERSGRLTYLTPDLKGSLLTLNFRNLDIFKVKRRTTASTKRPQPVVDYSLYFEGISIVKAADGKGAP